LAASATKNESPDFSGPSSFTLGVAWCARGLPIRLGKGSNPFTSTAVYEGSVTATSASWLPYSFWRGSNTAICNEGTMSARSLLWAAIRARNVRISSTKRSFWL